MLANTAAGVLDRRPGQVLRTSRPVQPDLGAEVHFWVLDALTANPEVWSKTALLVMFDENDGFFDHVAPRPRRA